MSWSTYIAILQAEEIVSQGVGAGAGAGAAVAIRKGASYLSARVGPKIASVFESFVGSQNKGPTGRTSLIDDLIAGGTKITPENVVDIRKLPDGRTVWLETGNSNAGLRHIVGEHGSEFAQRGIPEAEIPEVLFAALQRNNVVGYQGRGTGRPIYEFDYRGQTHRLAITVGSNGYVVGANFR